MYTLYLTRDGKYDLAAIRRGANYNFSVNRKRPGALSTEMERKIAHKDAWNRARSEKQRYDSLHHPERFRDVSRETSRELSTDGRLV